MKRHWMGGSNSQLASTKRNKEQVQREFFSELRRSKQPLASHGALKEELELCHGSRSAAQIVQIVPSKDLMILASPIPSSSHLIHPIAHQYHDTRSPTPSPSMSDGSSPRSSLLNNDRRTSWFGQPCSTPSTSEFNSVRQTPSLSKPPSPLLLHGASHSMIHTNDVPVQPIPIRPLHPCILHLLDRPTHPGPNHSASFYVE